MTQIIGVNGFKRSGKGETALAAQRLLDGNTKLVGFADKLKILAAKTLGFTDLSDEQCIALMDECKESWLIESVFRPGMIDFDPYGPLCQGGGIKSITGRQYLQNLGNQAREVFGENFWIDQVLPRPDAIDTELAERYPGVDYLLITDLRYENEARRIKALGGVIWEVKRPGTASDGHASEQPLPLGLVDWTFWNSGSLDKLEGLVSEAILETLN